MEDLWSPLGLAALVASGVVAGFVNTLAGGGSLLTLPALMLLGLPPDVANGTNRVGVLLQSLGAVRTFDRAARLDRGPLPWIVAPTLFGSAVGAALASSLPPEILEPVLLGTLVLMGIVLTLRPGSLAPLETTTPVHPRANRAAMGWLVVAGLYGGFIQAGIGFILLAVLGGGLRYDLVRANAIKVLVVGALTVVALGIFIAHDLVRWGPGLVLGASTLAGAVLGARYALRRGAEALRWIVLAAVFVTALVVALR